MENLPLFDGIREEWVDRGKLELLLDMVEIKFGSVPGELRTHLGGLQTHTGINARVGFGKPPWIPKTPQGGGPSLWCYLQ